MKKMFTFMIAMLWCFMAVAAPVGAGGYAEVTQNGDYQYGVNADVGSFGLYASGVNDADFYLTGRTQTDLTLAPGLVFTPRLDVNADYHKGVDGWYKSVYDRGRASVYQYGYLSESQDGWYKSVYGRGILYASPTDDLTVRSGLGYGFGQDNTQQTQIYAGVNYQYHLLNFDYDFNARKYGDVDKGDFNRFIHEFQLTYTGFVIEPYVLVGWDGGGDNDTYDRYAWAGLQLSF
jgi:hypothetical protein